MASFQPAEEALKNPLTAGSVMREMARRIRAPSGSPHDELFEQIATKPEIPRNSDSPSNTHPMPHLLVTPAKALSVPLEQKLRNPPSVDPWIEMESENLPCVIAPSNQQTGLIVSDVAPLLPSEDTLRNPSLVDSVIREPYAEPKTNTRSLPCPSLEALRSLPGRGIPNLDPETQSDTQIRSSSTPLPKPFPNSAERSVPDQDSDTQLEVQTRSSPPTSSRMSLDISLSLVYKWRARYFSVSAIPDSPTRPQRENRSQSAPPVPFAAPQFVPQTEVTTPAINGNIDAAGAVIPGPIHARLGRTWQQSQVWSASPYESFNQQPMVRCNSDPLPTRNAFGRQMPQVGIHGHHSKPNSEPLVQLGVHRTSPPDWGDANPPPPPPIICLSLETPLIVHGKDNVSPSKRACSTSRPWRRTLSQNQAKTLASDDPLVLVNEWDPPQPSPVEDAGPPPTVADLDAPPPCPEKNLNIPLLCDRPLPEVSQGLPCDASVEQKRSLFTKASRIFWTPRVIWNWLNKTEPPELPPKVNGSYAPPPSPSIPHDSPRDSYITEDGVDYMHDWLQAPPEHPHIEYGEAVQQDVPWQNLSIEDLNQVHVQETTHLEQLEKYFHDINESLMTQKYIIVNWNEQHGMMLQREKELEQLSADCRADLRCVQIKLTRLEELRIQKAQEEIQPQQPGQHKAAAIYYCIRCGQNGHVESSCTLWLDYQVTCTEGKKGSQGEQDLELEMPTLPQGAKIDHLCDNGPMQSDGGGVPL